MFTTRPSISVARETCTIADERTNETLHDAEAPNIPLRHTETASLEANVQYACFVVVEEEF